jgi:DNA-binding transcriptional ArsR family regulator
MVMNIDTFQVLADPARRRIIQALQAGERPVNDIVEQAGIHQSGVSRHLRILLQTGFVTMRPEGQRRLYSLQPAPFLELEQWLEQYRSLWNARLDRFGEALNQKQKTNPSEPKEPS